MSPDKKSATCGYEIIEEGQEEVMKINCIKCTHSPSVENSPICMAKTIDKLIEVPSVNRIIFSQNRNYEYDNEQTQMLRGVANLYVYLARQKNLLKFTIVENDPVCQKCYSKKYSELKFLTFSLLKSDPLGAYVELKRLLREERIRLKRETRENCIKCEKDFIKFLTSLLRLFEKLKLVNIAKPYLDGYRVGKRDVYNTIFRPAITPNFMFTRLMANPPVGGKILDAYSLDDIDINVYTVPGDIKYLYHVIPPEFKISEDEHQLLGLARNVLVEHKPKEEEFTDPARMRRTFFNIGRDLLQELAEKRHLNIKFSEINKLAGILVRYTVGFGLIEILLSDSKIQDVVINSPIGQTPIFIVHEDFGECVTNITPSFEDGESWATKFRLISGRPLDEANPVLDAELTLRNARARVAVMTRPLSPLGLSFALRRHRESPWTLPLFIQNKMIDPLGAGLISFLVDGARTILIAGTRSSGKTSLLDASLLEIMRKYRIITIEDTLELSTRRLRELGYNIQTMKVRSALMKGGTEISADEGIRTSLRLGDSCLIVGEVRSLEAKALYEAMRVGALANVVAGTIHGASPYGVFDRVVNDLEVPRTSFKATDIIIIANPIKSSDGLQKWKRVMQISEVRKHWEKDPLREQGFVDLMKYDIKTDKLEPSSDLVNGDSEVIKSVAANIKEWAGNWDAVWNNILLRANIKKELVDFANKYGMNELLEAEFVIQSNDKFHRICDTVRSEVGNLDNKKIFSEWKNWLKEEAKKKTILGVKRGVVV